MDNLKIEQIKALERIGNVQSLLNEAYRILGNPILTHNMEYKVIAYTENIVTDDPIWTEFVTSGTVGLERLEFYKDESFLNEAANTKKITFLISNKLKYDRIYGKLFTKDGIQVGCACVVACEKPFTDGDPELFEAICDAISEILKKDEIYLNHGLTFQDTLVGRLIDGDILDRELYIAHVESIYINLKASLYLAVVDTSQCTAVQITQYRDIYSNTLPAYKYIIYKNKILIIISTDNEVLNIVEDLLELHRLFSIHDLRVGMSSRFDNLFDLQEYYYQAVNALAYGLKSSGNQRIFLYSEIR